MIVGLNKVDITYKVSKKIYNKAILTPNMNEFKYNIDRIGKSFVQGFNSTKKLLIN